MKSCLLFIFAIVFSTTVSAQPSAVAMQPTGHFGFVENKGQITDQYGLSRSDIDFRLSSGNVHVFIGYGHIHYQWSAPSAPFSSNIGMDAKQYAPLSNADIDIYRMDVQLLGARENGQLQREGLQPYVENYYVPQVGSEGAVAKSYQKIVYKEVYPNIDWELYIKEGKLEQDFVVHPGGNVADIKVEFKGATSLSINGDGSFMAETPFGSISEAAPYSFQEDGEEVASAFVLSENVLGFTAASSVGKLTIDPTVSWSTYLGGYSIFDIFEDIHLSVYNQLYVGGTTFGASNIATAGAHQVTLEGPTDAVLKKFNNNGECLWATYYGGESEELFSSLSCDGAGNVYISGRTLSTMGVATGGSYQSVFNGTIMDAFIAKFDTSGRRVWGTYFGGEGLEDYVKVEVKDSVFFISGYTTSTSGIASANAHQSTIGDIPAGQEGDFFLAKFDLDGNKYWSTYYGGPGLEALMNSIACDNYGNVYLFGATFSESGIATSGAHKSTYVFNGMADHFLAKFNSEGVRQWATYYGGTEDELGMVFPRNLACDPFGNVYMAGTTSSLNGIAHSGSHQSSLGGGEDAYLAKFDSNGVVQWGTYYGGIDAEFGASVRMADSYSVYIVGSTNSTTGIVTDDAMQPAYAGGVGYGDAFLAKFDSEGGILYGSYFGGPGADVATAAAVDTTGYVYIVGFTNSVTGIATPGSHKSNYPGAIITNGMMAKLCFEAPASLLRIQGADSICRFEEATFLVTEVEDATDYIWTLPSGWTGSSNSHSISLTADDQSGALGLQVVRCGDTSEVVEFPVYVFPADPPIIRINGFELSTLRAYDSYEWLLNGQPIPGGDASTIVAMENGDYSVIVVNENGCIDTSEIYRVENVGLEDISDLSKHIRIFPNPATDKIYVQSPREVVINLMTIEGKMISRQRETVLDVRDYPAGIYLLRVSTSEGQLIKTEKIIKLK